MIHTGFVSRLLISIVALLALAGHALSHEVRPSIATLSLADAPAFTLTIDTNLEAMLAQIGPEHEDTDDAPNAALYNTLRELPPEQLEARFRDGLDAWLAQTGLMLGGEPAELALEEVAIPPVGDTDLARQSIIRLSGQVPAGADTLVWSWPESRGSSVLRVERPGEEVQAQFVQPGASTGEISLATRIDRPWWEAAWDYLVIGFTHIVPKGLDHILFVLGLFFLGTGLAALLWQVTAFTLAHSITLALGLYGIVNISPAIVEPLIAASIVYVAVENIFTRKLHAWRPLIVFAFGLLHGLGFAGILTEIGMPRSEFVLGLVSFNIGVELGQLAVIAAAFLLVGWAMGKEWYRSRIAIPASIAIALVGAYWFVERTLL